MFGNGMNQNTLIQIIEEQTSRDLWYITPGMKIFSSCSIKFCNVF